MSARYLSLAAATVAVGLAGYAGFVFYPRLGLSAGLGAGMLALAVAAGVASFFSPCSFPLLVSILGRSPSGTSTLVFAAALAAGATVFLLVFGTALAVAGAALFEDVSFASVGGRALRIAVGSLLVALGLVQTGRLRVSLRRFEPATHGFLRRQAGLRRRRPFAGFFLFGFGYLAAGFG